MSEAAPLPTEPLHPRRRPNPRPLLVILTVIALFGGSCTLQEMVQAGAEPPTREALSEALLAADPNLKASADPQRLEATISALHDATVEASRLGRSLRPFLVGFGVLLVAAYSYFAARAFAAFRYTPGAARPLASAATFVLPARVAMAAVEFAVARALAPINALAIQQALAVDPAAGPHAAGTLASIASATPVVMAVVVCALFGYARHYFRRPDVIARYEAPQAPR